MKHTDTQNEKFARARKNLEKIKGKQIDQVNSFLESLISQNAKTGNTGSLQGIWEEFDFEQDADLEEEIRIFRKESSQKILSKLS